MLTLAALALRLVRLTHFEVWVDEAATWWYATQTASGRLGEQMALEPTPPLYYLFLGGWMKLFGEGDLAMRLPSAVFGALAVPAVFLLARSWFGPRAGFFSAVLIALHPLHVFYSREARVYPLLLLLTVLLWWRLAHALESSSWRLWAQVGGLLALVCYCHFYGLFVGVAVGLAVLLLAASPEARWRGMVACTLAGASFLPYLWLTLPHLEQSGAAWSIEAMYRGSPEEVALGRVIEQQWIGADYSLYLRQMAIPPTSPEIRWLSLGVQMLLLGAALLRAREPSERRPIAALLLAWSIPFLLPWGWSLAVRPLFHPGRHDVLILGVLMVLLGAGVETLTSSRRSWVGPLLWIVLVAAAAHRLLWLQALPASEHYREPGEWLAEQVQPGDRVVACGIRRLATERYARLAGNPLSMVSFPASTDHHPGWADMGTLMQDPEALHLEAKERVGVWGREIRSDQRLFVLLQPYELAEGAASETWLVDRHLIENLWHAGWRRHDDAAAAVRKVAIFMPPEVVSPSGEQNRIDPAQEVEP